MPAFTVEVAREGLIKRMALHGPGDERNKLGEVVRSRRFNANGILMG